MSVLGALGMGSGLAVRLSSSTAVATPRGCAQVPLGPRGHGLRPAQAGAARPGATSEGPGQKTGFFVTRAQSGFVWFRN